MSEDQQSKTAPSLCDVLLVEAEEFTRFLEQKEETLKAAEIIGELLELNTHPSCYSLHHSRSDRHTDGEQCPVEVRANKAISRAYEFISNMPSE